MNSVERLRDYYPFSDDTMEAVERVAAVQAGLSYKDYFSKYEVGKPVDLESRNGDTASILIFPTERRNDVDPSSADIMYTSMACPIDPKSIYWALTIHRLFPDRMSVLVGNPAGPGYSGGSLSRSGRRIVSGSDFTPTVEPVLEELQKRHITITNQIGASQGVNRVNAATTNASRYDIQVSRMVHIEPSDPYERPIPTLAKDFFSSGKHLNHYIEAAGSDAFEQADRDCAGWASWISGLIFRPTNVAHSQGLAKGMYFPNTVDALNAGQSRLHAFWGTNSEMAADPINSMFYQSLITIMGSGRIEATRLPGQYHALSNDIHLLAALVHHAIAGDVID